MPLKPYVMAGIVCSLGLAPPAPAAAQQPLQLEEAVSIALRENRGLRLAGIEVGIAGAEVTRAEGDFDWTLRSNLRAHGAPEIDDTADSIQDLAAQVAIVRKLPWNTTVGLEGTVERFERDLGVAGSQARDWTALQLSLNQPLLRGFGSKVAEAGIARAEVQLQIERRRQWARTAELIRDVSIAYWDLAFATRNIEIERSALVLAKQQREITRKQVELGRLTAADELAVEGAIAQREEALISAQSLLLQRSIELRRLIGLPVNAGDPSLTAGDPPEAQPAAYNAEVLIKEMRDHNPELMTAHLAEERLRIEAMLASDAALPQLDLNLRVGPIGTQLDAAGAGGGLGDAAERLVQFEDLGYSARLDLVLPFENRAAEGAHQAAQLRVQGARILIEDLERRLSQVALVLLSQLDTAAQRMELTKSVTRFARSTSEQEQALFEVGRTTNFVVLQRHDQLREAQLRELAPVIDYLKATAMIEALTGKILDRYGVVR